MYEQAFRICQPDVPTELRNIKERLDIYNGEILDDLRTKMEQNKEDK